MGQIKTAQKNAVKVLDLEIASATDRIRWAHETYGDHLVLTTSFCVQSAVMLHLVADKCLKSP